VAKFLRKKSDGWVYTYNPVLARRNDMQEFEFDGQPPTQIADLTEFLTKEPKEKAVRRKKAEEKTEEQTPE
jgi:hypothetical protein